MRKYKILWILTVSTLLLSACNFPLFKGVPEEDEADALATIVAETVQAMESQAEQSILSDGATQTPSSQATPTTLAIPTTAPISGPPTQTPKPCNKPLLVEETIPDDSELQPGENFTKTWTFRNIGTCTWNTNYKLRFQSGDQLGAPAEVSMPATVTPDGQVVFSVNMTAPATPGTYQGYWNLYSDSNEYMGQIWVKVKTKDVLFRVSSVTYSMDSANIAMACPGKVTVTGNITTSREGRVTYYWTNSQGGQSETRAVNFDKAETRSVTYQMDVNASGSYWVRLFIAQPNNQLFGPKDFTVTCN